MGEDVANEKDALEGQASLFGDMDEKGASAAPARPATSPRARAAELNRLLNV